jgi:hypothetical protein
MERACLGTEEARDAREVLDRLVLDGTGRRAARLRHYGVSIGLMAGLVLDDGPSVAAKLFPSWHEHAYLEAGHRVRRDLYDEGYPAPRPIALTQFRDWPRLAVSGADWPRDCRRHPWHDRRLAGHDRGDHGVCEPVLETIV